ncbi:MAG: acyl-ACP thioesterase domain-containing protein [Rikenellaceae bacterium]
MSNAKEYLDHSFTVCSHEMDLWGFLKPASILNICQEVAYMHSSLYGFGFDSLVERGLAWVLSRVKIEIDRLPVWREKIVVRTWHKGESGIFSLRDYIFYDQDNQPIIRVTTSWIIINIASRRLQRPSRIFGADEPFKLLLYTEDAIEEPAEKIELRGQSMPLSDHYVSYSDLDVNQHVNNAKYLEWVCDRSPQQMQKNRYLKGLNINFNHEATFGQLVTMSAATPACDIFFVEGHVDSRSIFTAELLYGDR